MEKKLKAHSFLKLTMDSDPTKVADNSFVDALNVRVTARGKDTLLGITNEKGTEITKIVISTDLYNNDDSKSNIVGTYLGHCIIDDYLIIFTKTISTRKVPINHIYRADFSDDTNGYKVDELYYGQLNINNKVETLGISENEHIKKVYWVDGENQPRVINIVKDKLLEISPQAVFEKYYKDKNWVFDFIPKVELKEEVIVTKEFTSKGLFPAGVIQYVITYFNKYGQETLPVWISPLYYTSFKDRGGSPEERISNSFNINIRNLDPNYDYIRLYSIFRTSENGQPTAKIVSDTYIRDTDFKNTQVQVRGLSYKDNNTETSDSENASTTQTITRTLKKADSNNYAETVYRDSECVFLDNIQSKYNPLLARTSEQVSSSNANGLQIQGLNIIWGITALDDGYNETEIRGYKYYCWSRTYETQSAGDKFYTKSQISGVDKDDITYDPVYHWIEGTKWRMPTLEEASALKEKVIFIKKVDIGYELHFNTDEDNRLYITLPKYGYYPDTGDVTAELDKDKCIFWLGTCSNYSEAYALEVVEDESGNASLKINSYPKSYGIGMFPVYDEFDVLSDSTEEDSTSSQYEPSNYTDSITYDSSSSSIKKDSVNKYFRVTETDNATLYNTTSYSYVVLGSTSDSPGTENYGKVSYLNAYSNSSGSWYAIRTIYISDIVINESLPEEVKPKLFIRVLYPYATKYDTKGADYAEWEFEFDSEKDFNQWVFTLEKSWEFYDYGINNFQIVGYGCKFKGVYTKYEFVTAYGSKTTVKSAPNAYTNNVIYQLPITNIGKKALENGNFLCITDDNTQGENVDPTSLLNIGRVNLHAGTIEQKDNTLFLGDITLADTKEPSKIGNVSEIERGTRRLYFYWGTKQNIISYNSLTSYEPINFGGTDYASILTLTNPSTYKYGEVYRLGYQLQDDRGIWTEPILLNNGDNIIADATCDIKFKISTSGYIEVPVFKTTVNNLGNRYTRIRPLIVEPSRSNRRILAQGIVNPTVRSFYNNINNQSPNIQSSWFTRVIPNKNHQNLPYNNPMEGSYSQYKYLEILSGNLERNVEIQASGPITNADDVATSSEELFKYDSRNSNFVYELNSTWTKGYDDLKSTIDKKYYHWEALINNNYKSLYFIDTLFETFHSPDIELNEDNWAEDFSDVTAKVIDEVVPSKSYGKLQLTMKTSGILTEAPSDFSTEANCGKSLIAGLFYSDGSVDTFANGDHNGNYVYDKANGGRVKQWMVYPWHASGSFNNDVKRDTDKGSRTSVFKTKIISNIKYYSYRLSDFSSILTPPNVNITGSKVKLFTSDQVSAVDIDGKTYYGNIDTAFPTLGRVRPLFGLENKLKSNTSYKDDDFLKSNSYVSSKWLYDGLQPGEGANFDDDKFTYEGSIFAARMTGQASTIRMKYKSAPHAIIKFDKDLPTDKCKKDYSYLVEIGRHIDYPYGDFGEYTLANQKWIVAGDSVEIKEGQANIVWKYGDTYVQRFESLRTYPFTNEDENQIIDVASFICETRTNVDGCYDILRNQEASLVISPQNHNLLNPVYNQLNNFFSYRKLDKDYYKVNHFGNEIIYSLEKQPAAVVDSWTKVSSASTQYLDATLGDIISLSKDITSLYALQERGISKLDFNEKVQIPTTEGVPIEISNNYKYTGATVISDGVGLSSKDLVTNTKYGIYFVDRNTGGLYNLAEGKVVNIDSPKQMTSWFNQNYKNIKNIWCDNNYNEVYINNGEKTLVFNLLLGEFTSFINYQEAATMFSIKNNTYAITSEEDASKSTIHTLFTSDSCCNFFGTQYGYSFRFIENDAPSSIKMFTNLESRVEWFRTDDRNRYNDSTFFDKIIVANDYQKGESTLNQYGNILGSVKEGYRNSILAENKKKFKVWRTDIPRDRRDRMCNNWLSIELKKEAPTKGTLNYMLLHDLDVVYYI